MKKLLLVVVALTAGAAAGIVADRQLGLLARLPGLLPGGAAAPAAPAAQAPAEKKIRYWVAPMDPNYRRDGPGKSPMGMDLVPVYEEAADGGADPEGAPVVRISPEVVNNLGVRTAPARRETLTRLIKTVGFVAPDETRLSHLHLRVGGWVERLAVKSEGARVERGQELLALYSPELVNAQEEYLQALAGGGAGLIKASELRLYALGMAPQQLERLARTRKAERLVTVFASQDGVVTNLNVREGMNVTPAMELLTLTDLSSMWVQAEVFERHAGWVAVGQLAEATLPYLPGRQWQGQVDYVYPELDPVTRTLRVRLRFDNPGEELKPNMYAQVTLHAERRPDALSVPREALIRGGAGDRVVIALGGGRFQPRDVAVGIESGNRVEILSGLEAGEEVVVSSQFLIDSESSLKASFTRMAETAPAQPQAPATDPHAGHDHAPAGAAPETAAGMGVVRAVTPGTRTLNLEHEPLAALGWPAMTMDFAVAEDVDLAGVAPGDSVHFQIERRGDGGWVITVLHGMGH